MTGRQDVPGRQFLKILFIAGRPMLRPSFNIIPDDGLYQAEK
jgi:hypothetical protein